MIPITPVFNRALLHRRVDELGQERIAFRPHVNDSGIAEADVHRRRARNSMSLRADALAWGT
jgi:hypothetical protein